MRLLSCYISMIERPTPQPDSEHLLQLKSTMLEHWAHLPPEHQASMALMLYNQVRVGEYGPWLQRSVKVMD